MRKQRCPKRDRPEQINSGGRYALEEKGDCLATNSALKEHGNVPSKKTGIEKISSSQNACGAAPFPFQLFIGASHTISSRLQEQLWPSISDTSNSIAIAMDEGWYPMAIAMDEGWYPMAGTR